MRLNKSQRFKNMLQTFWKSKGNADDIMALIIVSHSVLKQGEGLVWSQIIEIINEVTNQEIDMNEVKNMVEQVNNQ